MQTKATRLFTSVALLLAAGAASACSSAPGSAPGSTTGDATAQPPGSPAPTAASTTMQPPGDSEGARVQAYLDARYTANDVRHTFETQAGELVDCVDFFAEPGVKALAARGTPLTEMPHITLSTDVEAQIAAVAPAGDDVSFDGAPDRNGSARACPDGTVPEIRLTAERIAKVGGLDAFLRAVHGKQGPEASRATSPGLDFAGYGHVTVAWDKISATSGMSTMTIASPAIPLEAYAQYDDHSLAQTWMYAGSEMGPGCGANCFQTVEAGWDVDYGLFGDLSPHLFVYATSDGYATTGCYDDWPGSTQRTCLPWVPLNSTYALGQALPASVPGGAQQELLVYTTINGAYQGWVLVIVVGGKPIVLGYYPTSDFGSGPMASAATTFRVGGEVYDGAAAGGGAWPSPVNVPMGMRGLGGPLPMYHQGNTWSAVHRNYQYDGVVAAPPPATTRPGSYTYDQTLAPGSSSWTNYFYFGDDLPYQEICKFCPPPK
jgi:hypothetical protein